MARVGEVGGVSLPGARMSLLDGSGTAAKHPWRAHSGHAKPLVGPGETSAVSTGMIVNDTGFRYTAAGAINGSRGVV